MLELVCFLLPLAAFSGWYLGKRSARNSAPAKGNTLLPKQNDKAVEAFIKMLDVSPESVETILALGNFFRRRGEVDQAISIHQNLVSKPNLTTKERCQCLLDLAQDYMCAGVYDRAESLLLEIINTFGYQLETTLRYLIDIYEREKDWEKALAITFRLQVISGEPRGHEIGHYYSELSELAWSKGKIKSAFKYLKEGRIHDPHSARINILQGCFELRLGKYQRALKSLKASCREAPLYLSEVLPMIKECFDKLGEKIGLEIYLTELKEKFGIEEWQKKPSYLCKQCGFSSRLLYWQCPSCRQWAALKSIQSDNEEEKA